MRLAYLALFVLLFANSVIAQQQKEGFDQDRVILASYDADGDARLDAAELAKYFEKHDPIVAKLREGGAGAKEMKQAIDDRVEDALTFKGQATSISLDDAEAFVRQFWRATAVRKFKIGWTGLAFRRYLADPVDPREPDPDPKPTVFSYVRDDEADRKNQFSFLGGVQLWRKTWEFGKLKERVITIKPGIQGNVDGAKPTEKTTLSFKLPFDYIHVLDPAALIGSFAVNASFVKKTDRSFDRNVTEVEMWATLSSQPLGRAGFVTRLAGDARSGPAATFYWRPWVGLEAGKIHNAGGNKDLEALAAQGAYVRVVPRVSATLRPLVISDRLRFSADYFHRFGLNQSLNEAYFEGRALYDLTTSGNVALTVVWQRGHEPPDFGRTRRVLIGLGILQ
jgi:hypothetical protein